MGTCVIYVWYYMWEGREGGVGILELDAMLVALPRSEAS